MQSITSKVFIPHDDLIWVCGEIVSEPTKETVEVRIIDKDLPLERGTKIISLPQLRLTNLPLQNVDLPADGVDDMCSLSYLHEPSILDNLRRWVARENVASSFLTLLYREFVLVFIADDS